MSLELLHQVVAGAPGTREQAADMLRAFAEDQATAEQLAAVLTALHIRGESSDVLTGFAEVLRERLIPIDLDGLPAVDVCGTGGDGQHTANLSTTAAFVVAGAGVPVAKHGNHGVSSRTGSADVLRALGLPLSRTPRESLRYLRESNLGFLYAPAHHPLFAKIAPVRRALGFRTAFNLLGPVCNPARVRRQVIGTFSPEAVATLAGVLRQLGTERTLVLHTPGPYDEVSLTAPAQGVLVEGDQVSHLHLPPEVFGTQSVAPEALLGGDGVRNADLLEGVLSGRPGGLRAAVCANAACALWVAGVVETFREGFSQAEASIDSGAALRVLNAHRQEAA